jgi:stage II sporulation protein D
MSRRSLGTLAALLAAVTPVVGAVPAFAASAGPALVIEGKGFGHGVGMAQDGALALASNGASAAAILSHFYPGTAIGRRSATVRVGVYDGPGPVVVVLPGGGEVRDAPGGGQSPGFPVAVSPGGSVALSFEGSKYKVTPQSGASITRTPAPAPPAPAPPAPAPAPAPAAPAPAAPTPPTTSLLDPLLQALLPTTVPPAPASTAPAPAAGAGGAAPVPATQNFAVTSRGLWAVPKGDSVVALPGPGRSYRGTVLAGAGGHGLQLTDEIDVEQYLRGMGEVRDPGWPPAALRAQAIAARTYALQAVAAGRTLCSDDQCQVYLGQTAEYAAMDRAVADTRGRVLVYGGALAETVYSANGGGVSATPEEGFGRSEPDHPYLRAAPYPSVDPQPWTVHTTLADLATRFGYAGNPVAARVSRAGPSGRALEVVIDGDAGPLAIDGRRFAATLGLRSTLFTLHPEEAGGPAADGTPTSSRDAAGSAAPAGLASAASRRGSRPLGRPPWVALALVLIATWATAATRLRHRLGTDGRE